MKKNIRAGMDRRGFTLIELLMVIILVSVAAAVAVPYLFRGTSSVSAGAFARKVRGDMRYAQSLALIRSNLDTPGATNPVFMYRIRFNFPDANCPGVNQYTIVNDADNNGIWGERPNAGGLVESARDPETGSDYFCVSMDSGPYSGLTVSADFGGSVPGVLQFDTVGAPYDSDRNALAARKTVTVAKGAETAAVTVTPYTGMVQ